LINDTKEDLMNDRIIKIINFHGYKIYQKSMYIYLFMYELLLIRHRQH